jgi:cephalosporin hydroxylase
LIFYASLLELIGGDRKVIGVDIEIRPHNRAAIEKHPMAHRIHMVEGSSVDPAVVKNVRELVAGKPKVIVALDSNHTRDHVLEELRAYEGLVRKGSYLVVFDTVIEDMPQHAFPQRTWGPGNNPKTAVHEFLRTNSRFVIDKEMNSKLLTTVCPDGYLRCVAD